MESEEPEIKSKQASKKDSTLTKLETATSSNEVKSYHASSLLGYSLTRSQLFVSLLSEKVEL